MSGGFWYGFLFRGPVTYIPCMYKSSVKCPNTTLSSTLISGLKSFFSLSPSVSQFHRSSNRSALDTTERCVKPDCVRWINGVNHANAGHRGRNSGRVYPTPDRLDIRGRLLQQYLPTIRRHLHRLGPAVRYILGHGSGDVPTTGGHYVVV